MSEEIIELAWEYYCPDVACNGLGIPAGCPARVYRAIYHRDNAQPLDFLHDRTGHRGDTGPLNDWLRVHGAMIQAHFAKVRIGDGSSGHVTYTDGKGMFVGTPNSSHGYMYCAAWMIPTT